MKQNNIFFLSVQLLSFVSSIVYGTDNKPKEKNKEYAVQSQLTET